MVGVPSHLEERELPGRLFGDHASHDDKTLGGFPTPWFVFELGKPNPWEGLLVMKAPEVSLNRLVVRATIA
jgi:hypothetical protein